MSKSILVLRAYVHKCSHLCYHKETWIRELSFRPAILERLRKNHFRQHFSDLPSQCRVPSILICTMDLEKWGKECSVPKTHFSFLTVFTCILHLISFGIMLSGTPAGETQTIFCDYDYSVLRSRRGSMKGNNRKVSE